MPDAPPQIVHASEIFAVAVFLFAATGTGALSLYVVGRWAWLKGRATELRRDSRRARAAAAAALAAGCAAGVWAWLVEPRMLVTTVLRVESAKLAPDARRPLRICFVSDLHVEPGWRMEGKLAERVARLEPDAILLGGDYLNVEDPGSLAMLEAEARALAAAAPSYAVMGNVDAYHDCARGILRRSGVRVLEGEAAVLVRGVAIHGAGYLDRAALERAAGAMDPALVNVLLTHAPGLVPDAAAAGFDLCLSGHTHGGQVRMPLWGALVTLAVHGKRFECGRYDVHGMTAFVTRGVGLEGGGLTPRVRFLCPPEVVLVELVRPAAPAREAADVP